MKTIIGFVCLLMVLVSGCSSEPNYYTPDDSCYYHENTRHASHDCESYVAMECDNGWYLEGTKDGEKLALKCDGDIVINCDRAFKSMDYYCGVTD